MNGNLKKLVIFFDERSEKGFEDLKLLSVTIKNGVMKRSEIEDKDNSNERKQIFKVHLKSRLKKPKVIGNFKIDEESLSHLASLTEGFGGAEIEQLIIMGLFDAFAENRSITMKDFENAINNTVPLSVTQAEQIRSIREWANIRAVAATTKEDRINYNNKIETNTTSDDTPESPDGSSDIKDSRGGRTLDF